MYLKIWAKDKKNCVIVNEESPHKCPVFIAGLRTTLHKIGNIKSILFEGPINYEPKGGERINFYTGIDKKYFSSYVIQNTILTHCLKHII